MVERGRDEGGAKAVGGPLRQDGALDGTEGERGEEERDREDDGRKLEQLEEEEEEEEEEWSEIRLAIEELSPAKLTRGGGKPAPTLPFLALSHLLLRVIDKIGPTMAVLRLDVQRNIETLGEEGSDQQSLAQLVEAAYEVTLKPWHGWISSAAYKVAVKLVPERKAFACLLLGMGQDRSVLKGEVQELASLLLPLLDDIHSMMAKFRLDRLKST